MRACGRFAPSPTGPLHFGSLVAALASWLCVRHAGGRWLVRIDDIDPPREAPRAAQTILAALDRLGLIPDAPPLFQSTRVDAYTRALERLVRTGHAFPCACSRSDLADCGGLHRDGRCVAPIKTGREPAWRLRVPPDTIAFDDRIAGWQRQAIAESSGDFVLKRADGLWSYQLACVVDDAWLGVTEVVRGADLVESTPRQILLQRLLDLPTPAYAHVPLVCDARGHKLSKSIGSAAIDPSRPAEALGAALAFLGQPVPRLAAPEVMLREAARAFDLDRVREVSRRRA